jgi:UDP-N-acetylglucosamine--N-acetylmuramyl-(pentapeptide) pyrophosphoryl-undecaprenol N-acetylglucosamine transferase
VVANLAPCAMILAGGTGGHVYPALAVAAELQGRGYDIHWMGTAAGLESRVVPEAGLPLHTLTVRGIRGKGLVARLGAVFALLGALLEALRLLRSIKPRVVLGMGGYVAGPGGLASWLLRKPLVIHEQNSVAGTTNRILYRFARRVACAYPGAFSGDRRARQVGNPVRSDLLARAGETVENFEGQRPLHLLVLGGSLGAQALNEVMPEAITRVARNRPLQVRHQTGVRHIDVVREAYACVEGVDVEPSAYIEDMAAAYSWADLVVCRAGALTLAELTIVGCPSILVPLPQAIDNHQLHNAEWLVSSGGAELMPQADMTSQDLAQRVLALIAEPSRLRAMAAAARNVAAPDAAQAVADICEEVADER